MKRKTGIRFGIRTENPACGSLCNPKKSLQIKHYPALQPKNGWLNLRKLAKTRKTVNKLPKSVTRAIDLHKSFGRGHIVDPEN